MIRSYLSTRELSHLKVNCILSPDMAIQHQLQLFKVPHTLECLLNTHNPTNKRYSVILNNLKISFGSSEKEAYLYAYDLFNTYFNTQLHTLIN